MINARQLALSRFPQVSAILLATTLAVGCGSDKFPILESDSPEVRALKEANANVKGVAMPGGMTSDDQAVSIDLSDVSVDGEIIELVNKISRVWELTFPNATDETVAQLGDSQTLTMLHLGGSAVTDAGLENLKSKSLPMLYTLVLDETHVTGDGLVHVPPQISGLSLAQLPIGDKDLENLEHLKKLSALTLTGTNVSAGAVRKLKQARPGLLVMGIKLK